VIDNNGDVSRVSRFKLAILSIKCPFKYLFEKVTKEPREEKIFKKTWVASSVEDAERNEMRFVLHCAKSRKSRKSLGRKVLERLREMKARNQKSPNFEQSGRFVLVLAEFRASRAVVFGFLTKLADTVVRRIPPSREFPNFSKCWTLACFGWLSAVEMPTKDDWMASCAKLINSTTLSACLVCPGERSVAWWEFAAIRDMRVSRILF